MALSLILGEAKLTAEHMETTAEVSLEKVADGFAITSVDLALTAKVPGTDQAKFEDLAGKGKAGCPDSKLLNAKITLDATLSQSTDQRRHLNVGDRERVLRSCA